MNHTGPIATMTTGAALLLAALATRGRRARRVPARAVARLVWDLTAGLLQLAVFAAIALAPRNAMPRPPIRRARIPAPITPTKARKLSKGAQK